MYRHNNQQTSMSAQATTGPASSSLMADSTTLSLGTYKTRKDSQRVSVLSKYDIIGYIASGTYGRVYKAKARTSGGGSNSNQTKYNSDNSFRKQGSLYAIKKFKSESRNDQSQYTGISQSACREMSLCKELNHSANLTRLVEIILEKKSIYMISEYAEYDLLQIIHYHSQQNSIPIPEKSLKSMLWQILNGVSYLHQNWVMHRDLKPANIMVTSEGVVKVGDLGLARRFNDALQTLYSGDKVVVTIWYRAPELILGARHYTASIDIWSIGCIIGELLALKPFFKGEEAKMDNKKTIPFQRNQMLRIMQVLGTPTTDQWQTLPQYPEYGLLSEMELFPNSLSSWYNCLPQAVLPDKTRKRRNSRSDSCFALLQDLLEYDPARRVSAIDSLTHDWFLEYPEVSMNVFEDSNIMYPPRKITRDGINKRHCEQTLSSGGNAAAANQLGISNSILLGLDNGSGNLGGFGNARKRARH